MHLHPAGRTGHARVVQLNPPMAWLIQHMIAGRGPVNVELELLAMEVLELRWQFALERHQDD